MSKFQCPVTRSSPYVSRTSNGRAIGFGLDAFQLLASCSRRSWRARWRGRKHCSRSLLGLSNDRVTGTIKRSLPTRIRMPHGARIGLLYAWNSLARRSARIEVREFSSDQSSSNYTVQGLETRSLVNICTSRHWGLPTSPLFTAWPNHATEPCASPHEGRPDCHLGEIVNCICSKRACTGPSSRCI